MRHVGVMTFLFLIGLAFSVSAAQMPSSFEGFKKWVGVFSLDGKENESLWDDPALQEAAQKALTPEAYELVFNQYSKQVTATLEQKGDVLYAFACKAHACDTDQVMLFVDLKKNTIAACVRKTGAPVETWYASGKKPRELDGEGCAIVDAFAVYEKYGKE